MNIEIVDIEEPVRLGFADIIYQGHDGIIIHELRSDALMVSMTNTEHFVEIFEEKHLYDFELFNVKQKEIKDLLVQKYHKKLQFSCYQAVYTNSDKLNISFPPNIFIHTLTLKDFPFIQNHYEHSDDVSHLKAIIERKHLWGIFENNHLAGFIGIHDEGSMGILEIKEDYKRKGYGYLLEGYLINYFLDHDWLPYCQVIENNKPSLALQKKLGLKISKQLSYWLFP